MKKSIFYFAIAATAVVTQSMLSSANAQGTGWYTVQKGCKCRNLNSYWTECIDSEGGRKQFRNDQQSPIDACTYTASYWDRIFKNAPDIRGAPNQNVNK